MSTVSKLYTDTLTISEVKFLTSGIIRATSSTGVLTVKNAISGVYPKLCGISNDVHELFLAVTALNNLPALSGFSPFILLFN